jgi:hypothetical protein
MKFLTKKSILGTFILAVSMFIIAVVLQETCSMETKSFCKQNWSHLAAVGRFSSATLLLLAPHLLTLPLNGLVFDAWKKFAVWAVPSVLVIVTALSFVEPGGSIGGMVEQRMLATAIIGLYAAYAIVSVSIIGTAWQKSRKS